MFNNQRVINKQWVISRIYIYISVYFFILSIYIAHLQATYTWTSLMSRRSQDTVVSIEDSKRCASQFSDADWVEPWRAWRMLEVFSE